MGGTFDNWGNAGDVLVSTPPFGWLESWDVGGVALQVHAVGSWRPGLLMILFTGVVGVLGFSALVLGTCCSGGWD